MLTTLTTNFFCISEAIVFFSSLTMHYIFVILYLACPPVRREILVCVTSACHVARNKNPVIITLVVRFIKILSKDCYHPYYSCHFYTISEQNHIAAPIKSSMNLCCNVFILFLQNWFPYFRLCL